MCSCQAQRSCHGCHHALDRRQFLRGCGTSAVAAASSLLAVSHANARTDDRQKVRVAVAFLSNIAIHEIWPYPNFDTEGRQAVVMSQLSQGCPDLEFVPVTIKQGSDVQKATALKETVDGYLIYVMTLDWGQRRSMMEIAELGKPTLVADEFLGGSGVFLTGYSALCSRKIPACAVSATRLEDLVTVARVFATVREAGSTPDSFAARCEKVYRQTFHRQEDTSVVDDALVVNEIDECVKRFRQASFLIVGRGNPGQEREFLGVKARYVDFAELKEIYDNIDRDNAAEWADRWTRRAVALPDGEYTGASQPTAEAITSAGQVYLATRKLLEKYDTDTVTMNCLGGFAAGKLPAYPCLGFMQILDDGGQGVCEAMPDDTLSMLMARILTGRPGFVSDPALDTSKNQIVYAHCVGTTKVLGNDGPTNPYRIRTLHNRDPRGACTESFMPDGYMTTTFRTNAARKQLIVHKAKSVGTIETERGCRTKLVGEVCGDIGKLFDQWDQFGWHRVTVFGDIQEPLAEFGMALGLDVIHEA